MKQKKLLLAKIINKHNSLTDGYIPKRPKQVLPDRLLNALYYKFEREGEEFTLSLGEIKRLLGIPNEKNDKRIYEAIRVLQSPIQIRNFTYEGKEIAWLSAPFLCRVVCYKSNVNKIAFKIEPMVIEAVKQKGGYTPLDLTICNRFKTKFGLKIYEMYRRYNSLPHKQAEVSSTDTGVIYKSLEELNNLFGTNYKTPSKLLSVKPSKTKPPINRGLEEIEKVTGEVIYCFYDKDLQKFVFSWDRKDKKYPTPSCIIPTTSIEPFAKWYMVHFADKVKEKRAYYKRIIEKIRNNTFGNLSRYYQLYLLDLGKDPLSAFDPKRGKFTV